MKAVVVRAPGDIRWEEVPDPDVPAGWARVEIRSVGICSSDVPRALDGTAYHYPIILGHEMSGIVVEVGRGGNPSLVGLRVAVPPLIPCYQCEWCARGRYSLCDDYGYLGSRRDGGCAEYVVAPLSNLVQLPDEVTFDAGALLEPASVVLHGLRGNVEPGDDVFVLGVGSLGLFAVQLAKVLGARRVFAIDLSGYRLEIAASLGAIPVHATSQYNEWDVLMRETHERGADLVVETTGASTVQSQCLELARKGGRVIYYGLPHEEVSVPERVFHRIVRGELQLNGAWNSFSAPFPGVEWQANVAYMASGQLQVDPIISHRLPLKGAQTAYRMIRGRSESLSKVVLNLESKPAN